MVKYIDDLDNVFGALAHPVRRAIVKRLRDTDEVTVGDLAKPFRMSLVAVSKHIRVLEEAGLVNRAVSGREHRLRLHAEPLASAAHWINDYRQFWQDSLVGLEQYVTRRRSQRD